MKALFRLILPMVFIAVAQAADWQTARVPGKLDFTGTAWLRAWVKVHDSFFLKHERNLFEESVGVNIRDLAGARPPEAREAREEGGGEAEREVVEQREARAHGMFPSIASSKTSMSSASLAMRKALSGRSPR